MGKQAFCVLAEFCLHTISLSIKGRKHGLFSFTSGGNHTMRTLPFSFSFK